MRCAPGSAHNPPGIPHIRALSVKKNSVAAGRTSEEGRTVFDLGLEKIYARTGILFMIVPARPAILYSAPEPLARKPCQARLERSTARVVKELSRVDAAWVYKPQEM